MKKIIKKLNNYRFTAFAVSIVSLVTAIISLGLLFIYYCAMGKDRNDIRIPSFANLGVAGKMYGMVFFLACVFVLALSIAIIYNLFPAIRNKNKVSPSKLPLILAVAVGCLQIVVLVFSILAIVIDKRPFEIKTVLPLPDGTEVNKTFSVILSAKPATYGLYIATIPFTIITLLANLFCIVPLIKCTFYMPEIKRD